MFDLAWDGKGLSLIMNDLPDDILKQFAVWRNERVEEENRQASKR
jgi:hypothetical protein